MVGSMSPNADAANDGRRTNQWTVKVHNWHSIALHCWEVALHHIPKICAAGTDALMDANDFIALTWRGLYSGGTEGL